MTNKPSWDDAPEWAMWLAQDFDGIWWWYAERPDTLEDERCFDSPGRTERAGIENDKWRETLERRP